MNFADLFRVTMPETVLEVAALLVLVVDLTALRNAAQKTRLTVAALLGAVGCLAALVTVLNTGGASLSFNGDLLLAVGGTAAVAQVAILALTALTLLLTVGMDFTRHGGEYTAVVLMAAAGGMLVSAAQDLLVIFIGLELLSLGLYILTAFAKTSGKSSEAAIKYYLFGGMSAAFLLFGFSYLYGIAGSTNLQQIIQATSGFGAYHTAPLLYAALVMVAAGLGFKVAAVPFHLWAPDAYEGAPAPAAAFIASVSKVASFALLISIGTAAWNLLGGVQGMTCPALAGMPAPQTLRYLGFRSVWMLILVTMAVASMVLGNLAALAQTSVRRLLAYSAIAHAGYMLLGLAYYSQTRTSADAILYYIITYGLTTIGAFGAVAVVEQATGGDSMDCFAGLHKRNPLLAGVLLVLFLSLAGIPPLVGFWAKFNLFAAVLSVGAGKTAFGLVALAIAMSAVSLYYYLQVLKRAYVLKPVDETPVKAHPLTTLVLLAITLSVVLLGCFPALLQGWIASF